MECLLGLVSHKHPELFYLRILLSHVEGPRSFEDLRVDPEDSSKHFDTYREAVCARGLVQDEQFWEKTLMEIVTMETDRKRLRETYASMLVFCQCSDQGKVWEKFKEHFASDFKYNAKQEEYTEEIFLDALDEIQEFVYNCSGMHITEYGLPSSRDGEKSCV